MPESPTQADLDEVAEHLERAFTALGLDAERDPELQGTARRVAGFWADRFRGLDMTDPPQVRVLSSKGANEDMIVIGGMPFTSMCAHHLTPIVGTANVGYIPAEKIMGIGTPGRVLEYFARRPQIQERLGEQIISYLASAIEPNGIVVHLQARQFCMELRGAEKSGYLETTATRGWFSDQEWRSEFFSRIRRGAGANL